MRNLIRALFRPRDDKLFSRAMSAGFWAAALRLTLRASFLIRTVILARLLIPDDFGLMAIATISILFVERLTESGINAALIQEEGDVTEYLDTAWTMQIVRSFLTAVALVLGAQYIAGFFDAPEAETIIRVLAISVILKGFSNIGVVLFQKELQLDRYFVLEMAGRGADVIVSIVLAIALRDVWALVFGTLAGATSRLAASYIIQDYRPRIRWIWTQVKHLFNFGKWILASNFINFVSGNIDDIIVGRILGVASLGLYRMAFNFSQVAATEIMGVANQVAFPTFAKLQGSPDRLRTAYLGSLHFVSFVGLPIGIGTVLIAPDLVHGLLGERWEPIIVPLQLLSIAGLVRGIGGTIGPLLQSQGRPDIPPRFSVARLAMLALFLYPAIGAWGINGAAFVVTVSGAITGTAAVIVALRWVNARSREIRQALLYPAFNTGMMAVAVLGVQMLMPDVNSVLLLLVSVATGGAAYLISVMASTKLLHYHAPSDLIGRVRRAAIG